MSVKMPTKTVKDRIIDTILWSIGTASILFVIWACFTQPMFDEKKEEPVVNKTYNITIVQCEDKRKEK